MSAPAIALWVVLPYVALTLFLLGHLWRWKSDQFGWTSRSSQLYEGTLLRWGSPLFHYGTLAAIGGHVVGILIPQSWLAALGINEATYRIGAGYLGALAACAVVVGLAILLYRRASNARVRRATTPMDLLAYSLMAVVVALGTWATVAVTLFGRGYNYRSTVAVWFRSIFAGDPRAALMSHAPAIYQIHAAAAWAFLAVFPFSRLVHAWSAPVWYLWRPYIVYRRRLATPPREPGTSRRWQRISSGQ